MWTALEVAERYPSINQECDATELQNELEYEQNSNMQLELLSHASYNALRVGRW